MKQVDRNALKEWEEYRLAILSSTTVDYHESEVDKLRRKAKLEASFEEWNKYYFPKYAYAEPAPFHIRSSRRVTGNPEWYEVRPWSRELSKSTRTMMESLYLCLTGRKKFVIMTSNSWDNACRLLMPFKINLEANQRIINDYGPQQRVGSWEDGEFTTRNGVAFRAVGAGQSPRGAKNEEVRPDVIIIDDIDTDDDCRNPDIIEKRWAWIEQALIGTRSISQPLLIIFNGNIIAEDCCITRAMKVADHSEVVNIRDKNGVSTWPNKNTEAHIDRVLSKISYESQQKEYFNNPMSQGKTFPEITWGKVPPMHSLPFVLIYADPATSNKDKPATRSRAQNSMKAIFLVGKQGMIYYVYSGFLDVMNNSHFIDALYATYDYAKRAKVRYCYVENNTLQDPFFAQVLMPLIVEKAKTAGEMLPVIPDTRQKPDKWFRIEGTLEPINRTGCLVFNEAEKNNPHMQRLEAQFKAAKPSSKLLDGPDCVEGGVYLVKNKMMDGGGTPVSLGKRKGNEKRY